MKNTKAIHLYLSELGRRGGSSRSLVKVEAARENGKLGGRPRKEKENVQRRKA